MRTSPTRVVPLPFLRTLWLAGAAAALVACSGPSGSGGGGGARGGRAADPQVDSEEQAARAAERRAERVTTGDRREVAASELSEADQEEFRRAWRLFVDHDPRWARAREDWLARGGPAPYLLAENLFRYFWSANALMKKEEIARVGREAAHVGEPSVGYFADLLVLERWPLREATTTTMFNPDNASKPLSGTVTHLQIDDVSRQNAARVLAAIGAPAVPTLASSRVLKASNPSSRTYAAYALGRIGGEQAVVALSEMLTTSPDWKERGAAAKALGFALPSTPSARPPLEAALRDADAFVRRKAEEALSGKANLEF